MRITYIISCLTSFFLANLIAYGANKSEKDSAFRAFSIEYSLTPQYSKIVNKFKDYEYSKGVKLLSHEILFRFSKKNGLSFGTGIGFIGRGEFYRAGHDTFDKNGTVHSYWEDGYYKEFFFCIGINLSYKWKLGRHMVMGPEAQALYGGIAKTKSSSSLFKYGGYGSESGFWIFSFPAYYYITKNLQINLIPTSSISFPNNLAKINGQVYEKRYFSYGMGIGIGYRW